MGFDFGLSRIGLAVGQSITGTASPVVVVNARDGKPDWNAVDAIVREWQPGLFVVGLPLNMDGTESDMSVRAEKFARRLAGRYNIPAKTSDERLTSREAREMSDDDAPVDAIAAQLILESYFRSIG
jgi:putative Holliday junction resolvase